MEPTQLNLPAPSPQPSNHPTSLTTLSTELLVTIFEYVGFRDARRLLTTCKLLHPIAKERFWSHIGFTEDECGSCGDCTDCSDSSLSYDSRGNQIDEQDELEGVEYSFEKRLRRGEKGRNFFIPSEWDMLIEKTHHGVEKLGWQYTKSITIDSPELCFDMALVNMLYGLMESGRLKPRYVYLDLGDSNRRGCISPTTGDLEACKNVLLMLKKSSECLPSNYTFGLKIPSQWLFDGVYIPDIRNLVELDLCLPLYRSDLNAIRQQIKKTAQTLSTTRRLRSLTINCRIKRGDFDERVFAVEDCAAEFAELQDAFTNLTSLRKLKIVSCLFHSAFFVTPPEGLRALQFKNCEVTGSWWEEFSRSSLPNLEWLKVETYRGFLGWAPGSGGRDLKLESFACTSLKYFHIRRDSYWEVPSGLARCILEGNKGLNEKCVERLFGHEVGAARSGCRSTLNKRLRAYDNEHLAEHRQKWVAGLRGQEFKEEYIRNYLQTLLKELNEGKLGRWDRMYNDHVLDQEI
ncbi:hypothetical protein TWF730_002278 [Orbilia blumenaviensis]|uniref:F-box domain-containing protein n=1 Tax=Orbilia blumenaviensis TaxID=1796055 RepID=A0AAV9UCX4_9PEZI